MSDKQLLKEEFYSYLEKTFDPKTNGKPTEEDMFKFACHFAEWQKKQILERMYDWCNCEFYVHPHDCHVIQYVTDKPMNDIDDFVEEFKNKILHFD